MAIKDLSTQDKTHLAHVIAYHPEKRLDVYLGIDAEARPEVFSLLSKATKQALVHQLSDEDLISLLNSLDPDDATDVLQLLSRHRQDKVMSEVSESLRDSVSGLLQFDPDTAAGLMTLDYVQVDMRETVADVARKFKQHEKRTGRPPVVLVQSDGRLTGFLPGHELGFAARTEKVGKYVKKLTTIHHSASHKEVIQIFKAHPHSKVAVLNDDDSVLGIIYSDDVLQLLHQQESASLYDFAGVSDEETVTDGAKRKIQLRYKWLVINLGTAFLAAFTVGQFEGVLSKFVLLAVYMPIVAGMGGNSATQTLAVMVRGIALRQVDLSTAYRTLRSELGSGLANGLINGFLVALVVLIVNRDAKIALILALAMVVNLLVAATFGTMVPLIMSKLKKDPAASATIFITTATDVLGFLVFLGLATLILM
jgi:magnesium transporter